MKSSSMHWAWVAARILVAFGVSYGIAVGLGALLHPHLRSDGSTGFDTTITNWFVQHRSADMTTWWKTVTWLGSSAVIVPIALGVIVLLLESRQRMLALFIALAVAGAALLNALVKQTIGRERPPFRLRLQHPLGSSFPSGHTTQAAATYLALALVAFLLTRSRVVRAGVCAGALVISVLVGLSRAYLGVHWATDALAGWLLGAVWVTGLAVALAPQRNAVRER
jgi:membrane-associated phospholipid phosphatase